ncbi:FAD-binding oxidoreductase [Streptomyces lunaelactis]|uniref:FAD-binding oxidoreductase n=1 Tax=Streptomyces lunaelactis TaxID=1535768 RepID=UPI00158462B1|nr:FAD-binding oxidoreductase [Streptomyces lunaelactis]NUK25185.1 FAD-binding oxidoreductase [Streptomyces lunaelactis]NUK50928.1 FAD-binding oxidoreductase [Streptomyces lunaelactis]NUK64042.1 FAD-binding oxidoreductase [Streptomyces lunaelactis]NUK82153.1 FAD-binding oxidoreductase [Streptomyces lunaelactis]
MTRSWWGWGNVEETVAGAELGALLARVRMLAPGDLTGHEPPDIPALGLPAPRVSAPAALAGLCSADPADRAGHAHGKAFRDVVRNLHGDLRQVPDLVARPRRERDLVDLLDWCARDGIAAIAYGGGSSVVGGIEPRFDDDRAAVTIDLGRLDRVLEIDPVSRAARIQAGVFGPHLEDQLRPYGLTLRHFPQSFEFSTLGGWLATRAGGHYATLRTHIDDMVESMRVVTPSGTSESRRLPGSGAGPSPDRLFLGSEGTLGVITEAWMRLEERPRWRARASVHFADYAAAVRATRAIAQSGLHPANCRLLDTAEALINAGVAVEGGVLMLGFESADHPVSTSLDRAGELCRDQGGEIIAGAGEESAGDTWRSSFLRMPYQRDALARHSVIVETFETACTWDRFEGLHHAVMQAAREAVRKVTGADGVVTCRFTHVYPDGPAPYFGVYAPGRWGSTVAQWDEIKAAVSEAIAHNGGTITHHHAVGRDHRPWYDVQRPDPFAAALTAAKAALDPAGILNPGVLVPPR